MDNGIVLGQTKDLDNRVLSGTCCPMCRPCVAHDLHSLSMPWCSTVGAGPTRRYTAPFQPC